MRILNGYENIECNIKQTKAYKRNREPDVSLVKEFYSRFDVIVFI